MPFSPSERERTACSDIIVNAQRVARFVAGFTFETFEADERTHFAVVRCLEIVSEASRRSSAEIESPASGACRGDRSRMRATSIATLPSGDAGHRLAHRPPRAARPRRGLPRRAGPLRPTPDRPETPAPMTVETAAARPKPVGPGDQVILVDGSSLHLPGLFPVDQPGPEVQFRPSDGLPTGAVRLFCTKIAPVPAGGRRRHDADPSRHRLRQVRGLVPQGDVPDYKGHRPDAPDDLKRADAADARRGAGLRPAAVELERYEADDLIATYTRQARRGAPASSSSPPTRT